MQGAFAKVGDGSGKLVDLFGFTRYGRNKAPNPIVIGRHESYENLDTGPGPYAKLDQTGQYKPNALVVSRRRMKPVGHGSGRFENLYGMTRFGPAHPPSAVIVSRHQLKDKEEPGPGAYDPHKIRDTRVGILIRGRRKGLEPESQAGDYLLPEVMGTGPAFSLKSRHPGIEEGTSSPGPIYLVPPIRKRGQSLTFKPFPMRGKEEDPGPLHYGTLPGWQAINGTLYKFPAVKFAGKDFCPTCEWPPPNCTSDGPGPAAFNIDRPSASPKAIITARPKFKFESCGSGKMHNLFGMTRFGPSKRPNAVICPRHIPKVKFEPGPGAYDPQKIVDKRVGIKIKSRLKGLELNSPQPGPNKYNIQGYMGRGPAFSLGLKNAGAKPKLEKIPPADFTNLTDCYPPKSPKAAQCCVPVSGYDQKPRGDHLRKTFPLEYEELIPMLEDMITMC